MQNLDRHRKNLLRLPDILILAICILSFILSVIESRLNTDALHWGIMYANAIDLARGLTPFKEIFIQYGILTTMIQSIALILLGNKAISIGIVTGLFYSANLYISYRLWQKILPKNLACFSAILMFLIQGYIIYPWPNYFAYTFFLLCLLIVVNSPLNKPDIRYVIAGVFFALNVMARHTVFTLTLFPIYLYFALSYWQEPRDSRINIIKNIGLFHLGLGAILLSFFLYLVKISALREWYLQNVVLLSIYKSYFGGTKATILRFVNSLFISPFLTLDFRLIIYLFNLLNACYLAIRLLPQTLRIEKNSSPFAKDNKILFLFLCITLFGYLQSIHIYELFRLQSSSSIGLGLLTLSGLKFTESIPKRQRYVILSVIAAIGVYLGSTLIGVNSSSVYYRWPKELLFTQQLQPPNNISIFEGKLFNSQTKNYYESIANVVNSYKNKVDYVVNFSRDSYFLYLSDNFKKVQISPYYDENVVEKVLLGERQRIEQVIHQENAIYFTEFRKAKEWREIPENYCIVFHARKPKGIRFLFRNQYVLAPKKLSDKCIDSERLKKLDFKNDKLQKETLKQ